MDPVGVSGRVRKSRHVACVLPIFKRWRDMAREKCSCLGREKERENSRPSLQSLNTHLHPPGPPAAPPLSCTHLPRHSLFLLPSKDSVVRVLFGSGWQVAHFWKPLRSHPPLSAFQCQSRLRQGSANVLPVFSKRGKGEGGRGCECKHKGWPFPESGEFFLPSNWDVWLFVLPVNSS